MGAGGAQPEGLKGPSPKGTHSWRAGMSWKGPISIGKRGGGLGGMFHNARKTLGVCKKLEWNNSDIEFCPRPSRWTQPCLITGNAEGRDLAEEHGYADLFTGSAWMLRCWITLCSVLRRGFFTWDLSVVFGNATTYCEITDLGSENAYEFPILGIYN